jgi:hypothetical protein
VAEIINTSLPSCLRKKSSSFFDHKNESDLSKSVMVMCVLAQFRSSSFWMKPIFADGTGEKHPPPTKQEIGRIKDVVAVNMRSYIGHASDEDIIKSIKTMIAFMAAYGYVNDTTSPEVYFEETGWNENDFLFVRNENAPDISQVSDDDIPDEAELGAGGTGQGQAEVHDDQEEQDEPQDEEVEEAEEEQEDLTKKKKKKPTKQRGLKSKGQASTGKKRCAQPQDAAPPMKRAKQAVAAANMASVGAAADKAPPGKGGTEKSKKSRK